MLTVDRPRPRFSFATEESCEAIDVLIAEDDPDVRRVLRLLLECEGYTCAEAEDGREAVEIAQKNPPRLVLLDLMMPGMDGFTLAQKLRSDPHTRTAHLYCLTALDFPEARRAARQAGCEVYLTKPFDMEGLVDVITTALNSGQY
jgi:CheY-like chemotaxis protein